MKFKSSITYHSKAMANVKVLADKQMDRRTGQKLYHPDLSMRGHKNQPGCNEKKEKILVISTFSFLLHVFKTFLPQDSKKLGTV